MSISTLKRSLLLTSTSAMLLFTAADAVTVHINSGNPKYPFPQFLSYTNGANHKLENLGTQNPEGVVHAEMEQDIRDAYQIFANEWTYTGESWGGVPYIRGNIGCPYDCREGDGYSLLAAAIMGDKVSFDGLWMRLHDEFRVKTHKYSDGTMTMGDYAYGDYATKDNDDAATDGDVDVAIAMYIAWRQWGDLMGIKDAQGNDISYRKELIDLIHAFVHLQTRFPDDGEPRRYVTGEIGLDGYLKSGNTWPEITGYCNTNFPTVDGVQMRPEFAGPNNAHSDYFASSYFAEFFDLLDELKPDEVTEFEKNQFKRCAAATDWIVGAWIGQNDKNIFIGEEVSVEGDKVALIAGNQGGRFRSAWRTALNYTWHGNPDYTWNPNTHEVTAGGNTYELDASKRYAKYMSDPQAWDPASKCTEYGGPLPLTFKGPSTLHWDVQPDGSFVESEFNFNWIPGCGMPSAVNSQDLDLVGLLYRQCNIEWDIVDQGDGYITSTPHYFHGWFRLLGMLVATGNHIAPSQMATAKPNMKIYRSIEDSLSFAYTGDIFTYHLDYRNYGSADAKGVKIVENVPKDFIFVSATDGGVYDPATHTVTWDIGNVPGFKSDDVTGPVLDVTATNLAKTMGQVSYDVKVGPEAFGRYCTTAEISCSNGDSWVSNEYPNHITATMQRNCVDVIKRALKIEKTADVEKVNPGNTVTYTINFENSSEAGWLDGGRPRVNIGFANSGKAQTSQQWLKFRLYNDAIEPYIDYGNYRISYYMYDSNLKCVTSDPDCPVGWGWYTAVYEGKRSTSDEIKVTHETIVEGKDDKGSWNQRMSLQFSPLLVTTSAHISNYYGMGSRIHRGGTETLRAYGYIFPSTWSNSDFGDDWSWDAKAGDADDGVYFPVTPSWQEIDPLTGKSIEKPVNEYIPSACETPSHTIDNILVEEFDGYVWRRILGTGPMAGREANNVVVTDTLPLGMTFVTFKNSCPLEDYGASWDAFKIKDGRWVVKWEIPVMQVKQKGSIIYTAEASFPSGKTCETEDEETENVAWIAADLNSPLSDTAIVTVTCAKVPEPIKPTTLTKVADKDVYEVGDEITYTIGYKQTHGAVFDNAGKNASDWTLSGASLSNGTLAISDKSTAKFNKSLAKNCYIEMDCELTQYASTQIVLRDNIKLTIKPDWATMTITCTDGGTVKKQAEVVFQDSKCTLRLQLTDNNLQLWLNNDTTNSATFIVDDLTTTKEGYLSFNGIEAGSFKYSNIHVHTDYAYDLSIIDRVPEEVTPDEGSFEAFHNGKAAGTGKLMKADPGIAQDFIVWTGLADNPVAFGDTFTVTWKGTVTECDESIINVAYASLLGHKPYNIMAQAVSGCGTQACPLDGATVTLVPDSATFCETDSSALRVELLDGNGDKIKGSFLYLFSAGGTSTGTPSKTDTLAVKASGEYAVTVYDASDNTCLAKSDPVEITTVEMPQTVLKDAQSCVGVPVDLQAMDTPGKEYTFQWTDGQQNPVGTGNTLQVDKEGTYIVNVLSQHCTASDTAEVTFGQAKLSGGIFTLNGTEYDRATTDTGTICSENDENTLSVNYVSDDGNYTWTSKPADNGMTATGSSITIKPLETTTYYVTFMQQCEAVDSFTVVIGKPMEVTIEADTVCGEITLTAATADSKAPKYEWTIDGSQTSTANPLSLAATDSPSGKVSVVATADDACQSETVTYEYQHVDLKVEIDGSPSVCPGNTTELKAIYSTTGASDPDAVKYTTEWTNTTTGDVLSATDSYKAAPGSYKVTVDNGYCKKSATHTVSEGNGEINGDLTVANEAGDKTKVIGTGKNRSYGSCGGELTITADYITTQGDFTWKVDGALQNSTTNQLTITPTQWSTKVTIEFTNQCQAYDTIYINMTDSVHIDVAETHECGLTTLTASTDVAGADITWTLPDGISQAKGKQVGIDIANNPTGEAKAYVRATADGHCPSKVDTVSFRIDTLGLTIGDIAQICPGETTTLPITIATNIQDTTPGGDVIYPVVYISVNKAGSNGPSRSLVLKKSPTTINYPLSALDETTEYYVTVARITCKASATATVKVGSPQRAGAITINGQPVTATGKGGTKEFTACGGVPLQIAMTHTADEGSINWVREGETAALAATASVDIVTLDTDNHTERYIVNYTNQCAAADTIDVVVKPFAATADFSAFTGTYCEGETATAALTLTGYDAKAPGAYIKWSKDGTEQPQLQGMQSLTFKGLKTEDSGTYTFEASNGVCMKPDAPESGTLQVNRKVNITDQPATIVMGRGTDSTITIATDPATAGIDWYTTGGSAYATGNPLMLTGVTEDLKLKGIVTASGYCDDSLSLSVVVDAMPVVKIAADSDYVCFSADAMLTTDTTGTGRLLEPSQFKICYYAKTPGETSYKLITDNGSLNQPVHITGTTTTYKARVVYRGISAESDPITITAYPAPVYKLDYEKTLCAGSTSVINIENLSPDTAKIEWTADPTLTAAGQSATIEPDESTTGYSFSILQNDGKCVTTVDVPVAAVPQIEILANDTFICSGGTVAIEAASRGAKAYRWTAAGSDSTLGTGTRLKVAPETTTTYTVKATNNVCDSMEKDVTVEVKELPVISAITTMGPREVKVEATGGEEPYEIAVEPYDYQQSNIIELGAYGVHTFHVRDLWGCESSLKDTLEAPKISIPTVVTPNGDGVNDMFTVQELAQAYPDARIRIYDRWGKQVADYTAADGDWDGTYNGKPLPSTDYWYEISIDEIDKVYTGHFTLLRSK